MSRQAVINNQQNFETFLKTNPQAMVLFYSTWCPFCRRFLPVFEKIAGENRRNITYCLSPDQDVLEDRYRVKIVPTVLFFENGAVVKRLDGVAGVGIYEHQMVDFMNTCGNPK